MSVRATWINGYVLDIELPRFSNDSLVRMYLTDGISRNRENSIIEILNSRELDGEDIISVWESNGITIDND